MYSIVSTVSSVHLLGFVLLLNMDDVDLCLPHSYLNDSRHGMPIAYTDPGITGRISVPIIGCRFSDMNYITVNSCNVFRELSPPVSSDGNICEIHHFLGSALKLLSSS